MDRPVTCGQLLAVALVAAVIGACAAFGEFWWRAEDADRDARACIAAGANPVQMSGGRVECVK